MNLAARIPGKADYAEVVRAYAAQLAALGARVLTGRRATPSSWRRRATRRS